MTKFETTCLERQPAHQRAKQTEHHWPTQHAHLRVHYGRTSCSLLTCTVHSSTAACFSAIASELGLTGAFSSAFVSSVVTCRVFQDVSHAHSSSTCAAAHGKHMAA